jgi:uncharacterized protein (TIGR02145 family)
MYRYAFLLLCLGVMKISFSQSKKEQIEILNKRVDSLNQVVSSKDKSINDQTLQINSLNSTITSLEGKITSLNSNVGKLNSEVQSLTSDSKNKQQEINQKKEEINRLKDSLTFVSKNKQQEINQKKEEINRLELQLKTKSDSLTLLKGELEKLKPVVKPVVNNTPVKNTPSGPYKTVTIGTQVWMKENLSVSTFRNGDPIPEAKTDEEWERAGEEGKPAWCYYDNDVKNGTKYGKLYNWYAVNDARGLAPSGYHVPTDEEWKMIKDFLGDDAGTKMKSTSGWDNWSEDLICANCKNWNAEYRKLTACHVCQNTGYHGTKLRAGNGKNSSGFSGYPGGSRYRNKAVGRDDGVGYYGSWWSSSTIGDRAWCYNLDKRFRNLIPVTSHKKDGLSVRCLKD